MLYILYLPSQTSHGKGTARGAPPAQLATAMDSLASPVCWDSLVVQSEGRWPHPIPWHHPPWWLRERRQRMEFQASRPEAIWLTHWPFNDHSATLPHCQPCAAAQFQWFLPWPKACIDLASQLKSKVTGCCGMLGPLWCTVLSVS